MPKILPLEIKSDSIAVYGNIIGIRKMQYRIPMFHTVDILPTDMNLTEQVLIANSFTPDETPSKIEEALIGVGAMLSETPSRAETVIITNV